MARMGELVASLAGLPGVGQDRVHGPLRGEVDALVEQGGDHLGRATSTNRGACSTSRTVWRSASLSDRGGRGRGGLDAAGADGRRRRYSVAREIPSARQAWVAPRSGVTVEMAA